jgi:hypothetical protein
LFEHTGSSGAGKKGSKASSLGSLVSFDEEEEPVVVLPVKKTGKGGLGGMLGAPKATTGGQKFSSKKERKDKDQDKAAPTSTPADAIRPQVRT